MKFKEVDIFYKKEGVGETLVLLHGFLHSSEMWANFTSKCLKNYSIIAIDLPGHGKSGVLKNTSITEMAEVVNAVLVTEGVEKAYVIGHSLGGYVSLAFADLFPEKVKSITLLHSSAFADNEEVKKKRNLWLKIIDRHPSMFVKSVIEHLYTKQHLIRLKDIVEKDIQKAKEVGFGGYIEATKAMRDRPSRIHVLKSNIIVNIIAGKDDKVIDETVSLEQIKMLKKGIGIFLKDVSHMGFIEDSVACFDALEECLKVR